MKITFLGDSLTQGGYGGNFVAEVARLLPEHDIVNTGIAGNTAVNLLARLEAILEDAPDVVFVMVGGNDAISSLYPAAQGYYKLSQAIPDGVVTPEQFAQAYRDLLTQIQIAHIQAFVGLPFVEYSPALVERLSQYNALAREIAASFNIPILDLAAQFTPENLPAAPPIDLKFIQQIGERSVSGWSDYETERVKRGYTYTFDGLHLMPETAKMVGRMIAEFIQANL